MAKSGLSCGTEVDLVKVASFAGLNLDLVRVD